jgi:molecular chaperone DnaK
MTGVGIDFGTSYSVVGYADSHGADVIRGDDDSYRVPSVVHLTDDGAAVGNRALDESVKQPQNTVWSIKRHLGTDNTITVRQNEYHPTDIAGLIFKKLRKRAAIELDQKIPTAVVTVPAQYDPAQRRQVEVAANKAGVTVSRILSEPVAICLSHGVQTSRNQTLLVLDLGGGTFDVSLVDVSGQFFDVVRTHGHPKLGGDDWDGKVFEWVRDQLEAEHGVQITPEEHPVATQQLFDAITDVKKDLSGSSQTGIINVPQLYGDHPIESVQQQLTRDKFQEITEPLLDEFLSTIEELVQDENLQYGRYNRLDVDKVILAGGATQMPQIEDGLTSEYDDLDLLRLDTPGAGVALGAALQSHQLRHNALPSVDTEITSQNGVSHKGTHRDRIVPVKKAPDAIAVIDSAPDTFGIGHTGATFEGYTPLIRKGDSLPCQGSVKLTSLLQNRRKLRVPIFRGSEETQLEELEMIDKFGVGPIPAKKAWRQRMRIIMRMTSSGLLEIKAEIEDQGVQNRAVLDGLTSGSLQDSQQPDSQAELKDRQETEYADLPKLLD